MSDAVELPHLRATTLVAIRTETARALEKHGLAESALSPTLPDLAKLPILGEEYGEVCRALTYDNNEGLAHLRDELIQVASVASGWAQSITDRLERMPQDDDVVVVSET